MLHKHHRASARENVEIVGHQRPLLTFRLRHSSLPSKGNSCACVLPPACWIGVSDMVRMCNSIFSDMCHNVTSPLTRATKPSKQRFPKCMCPCTLGLNVPAIMASTRLFNDCFLVFTALSKNARRRPPSWQELVTAADNWPTKRRSNTILNCFKEWSL